MTLLDWIIVVGTWAMPFIVIAVKLRQDRERKDWKP